MKLSSSASKHGGRALAFASLVFFPFLSLWLSFRYTDARLRGTFLNIALFGIWALAMYLGLLWLAPRTPVKLALESIGFLVAYLAIFHCFTYYKVQTENTPYPQQA